MASSHLADLSQAWDNYMDCRAQGADLQVSASIRQTLFVGLVKYLSLKVMQFKQRFEVSKLCGWCIRQTFPVDFLKYLHLVLLFLENYHPSL